MDNDRQLAANLPGALKNWSRRDFLTRTGMGAAALALSGGAGALLEACGGAGGGGGGLAANQTLRIYLNTEPGTLDPNIQQWNYEAEVGRNMYEALLRPKLDNSDVQGAAAEGFTVSSDGLTYEFSLRKDAKWSDGKPVTSQDFLYAYQRILDPSLAAPYVDPFFDGTIKGADKYADVDPKDASGVAAFKAQLGLAAPDDHTFRVTLQQPTPYFKWIASLWLAVPVRKDMVEKSPDTWANNPSTAISNGWFKMKEYVPKDHVTLVPNEHYWGTKPKIQTLQQLIITDETSAFAKYQNGELDIATVPQADIKAYLHNAEVVQQPQLTVYWVEVNTAKAPFDNPKVRMALAKAFDRNKFVADVLQGVGLAAETFIPKGMNGYDPSLGSYQKFDVSAAKKLLQESGVSADKLNGVNIDYRADTPLSKNSTEYMVAQYKQNLGITFQANPVDSKTLSANLKAGNFSLMVFSGWGADYPDQQDWFDNNLTPPSLTNRGNNFSGYSNSSYDKLIKQADSIEDESKRNNLYAQAHKMLCQDAPMIFVYQRTGLPIIKKYVKGMHINPIDDYPFVGDFDTPSIYIQQH